MPFYRLDDKEIYFPNPKLAEEDGLLAIGGDLSVDRLLLAYTNGIFPWYNPGEEILWWCPKQRYIIYPSKIHVSHSMKKFFRKHDCRIVINRDFRDTMNQCRKLREGNTWISDEMQEAYYNLFKSNFALSVEAYIDNELAGGLYGVCLGRCFFGESMFTLIENGSKVALILLADLLEDNNFEFIDCQFHTDHLETMGGEYIDYDSYFKLIQKGLDKCDK